MQRIKKTKSWFFAKINKIDKALGNLTKMMREKTQINKTRNEKGEIATNTKDIQGIIRDYLEGSYAHHYTTNASKGLL
jgi:hypothetical protein